MRARTGIRSAAVSPGASTRDAAQGQVDARGATRREAAISASSMSAMQAAQWAAGSDRMSRMAGRPRPGPRGAAPGGPRRRPGRRRGGAEAAGGQFGHVSSSRRADGKDRRWRKAVPSAAVAVTSAPSCPGPAGTGARQAARRLGESAPASRRRGRASAGAAAPKGSAARPPAPPIQHGQDQHPVAVLAQPAPVQPSASCACRSASKCWQAT